LTDTESEGTLATSKDLLRCFNGHGCSSEGWCKFVQTIRKVADVTHAINSLGSLVYWIVHERYIQTRVYVNWRS
jgi:hypothetical protein